MHSSLFLLFINLIVVKNGVLAENLSMVKKFNIPHHRTARDIDCFGQGEEFANIFERFLYGKDYTADESKIKFIFNSRDKAEQREFVLGDKLNLTQLDFKVERRTAIIVHGFRSSMKKPWAKNMEKAYLLWKDANVVLVDWSEYAGKFNYYYAVIHTRSVSRAIIKVLNEIINITIASSANKSINWGPIHMIGHSLGAQICGIAANEYRKSSTPWKITRLTALDPARPCFERPEINKNVAPFVDVIHTNGRDEKQSLGLAEPIGHMDFYPNGGQKQLGCTSKPTTRTGILGYISRFSTSVKKAMCSHKRSQDFFTESLIEAHYKNGSFYGHHWNRSNKDALRIIDDETCEKDVCPEMGINAENYTQRGIFFVKVSESLPYSVIKPTDVLEMKKLIEN